jgi:hypothetical protein
MLNGLASKYEVVSFLMVVGMLLYLFILQLKLMGIQFIIVFMMM